MSARTQGVLVELSWILIALIELAPLEENMNPLVFGAQPKIFLKSFDGDIDGSKITTEF